MDAIEKRARELLAAQYRKASISDDFVSCCIEGDAMLTWQERMAVDAIRAALLLGRPVHLLDQDGASRIEADHPQIVSPAAAGTHEVHPEAVDVGLDFAESRERRTTANAGEQWSAGEHWIGVRPEDDGQATAIHSAHNVEMVERARALLAAEYRKAGANPAACNLMAGRASWPNQMALNAIIAALTPPEGYIAERGVLVAATRLRKLASAAAPMARSAYIKAAEIVEMAVIAARPEVG